ncbi:type I-U CRISPR-associated RAMP protein Csb1/Cas7u [Nocardioides hungaricus]
MTGLTINRLRALVQEDEFAVGRITTTYEPGGGPGARVFPPTYPVDRDGSPYLLEERWADGNPRKAVVLDQVPSQANRVEESLLAALRGGEVRLPDIRIEHRGQVDLDLSALEAPHRYADAFLRDSEIDGVKFDRTDLGKSFQAATLADASALLRHDPGSLVFGAWNSHRKGRQAKFPRIFSSEVVGWDPVVGSRRAGRMDPVNLIGARTGDGDDWQYVVAGTKTKSAKLSEIGHGNIAPNDAHGGVTISSAGRYATLSLTALRRIRFGAAGSGAQVAARTLLAAYALLGDRLAFGSAGLWLRSGCDLVVTAETMQWVGRGGTVEDFDLSVPAALALFESARIEADEAGLGVALDPIVLTPTKALAEAIDFSLTKAATED